MLDHGPDLVQIMRRSVLDKEDAVRIAHVDRRRAEQHRRIDGPNLDIQGAGIHALSQRNVMPVELGLSHVDSYPSVGLPPAADKAPWRGNGYGRLPALRQKQVSHAARSVSASTGRASIRVPDPHPDIVPMPIPFNRDELVEPDAPMPVADATSGLGTERNRLVSCIDDHEVVAKPVHLVE